MSIVGTVDGSSVGRSGAPGGVPFMRTPCHNGGVASLDMEFRHLGRSGLKISAISYGNWITHGSQVGDQDAIDCVHAALDLGITTFDTADVYAGTRAEVVLGKALESQRRESLEIFTKVFWPTGPGPNDQGLSRKHIMESCEASLRRVGVDYFDLYQAHRFDTDTPLEETMVAFADLVRAGKVLYIGVSEWTAEQIRDAAALAKELRVPFVSNQPQYSMLWRVIEDRGRADVRRGRRVPDRVVADRTGRAHRQVPARPARPRRFRAPPTTRAAPTSCSASCATTCSRRCSSSCRSPTSSACRWRSSRSAWVLRNPNVASAIVGASKPSQLRDNVGALDVTLDDDVVARIDEILDPVVVRDPAMTSKMAPRGRI